MEWLGWSRNKVAVVCDLRCAKIRSQAVLFSHDSMVSKASNLSCSEESKHIEMVPAVLTTGSYICFSVFEKSCGFSILELIAAVPDRTEPRTKFEISKNREPDRGSKMRFGFGRFRFDSRFQSVLGPFAHPYFRLWITVILLSNYIFNCILRCRLGGLPYDSSFNFQILCVSWQQFTFIVFQAAGYYFPI